MNKSVYKKAAAFGLACAMAFQIGCPATEAVTVEAKASVDKQAEKIVKKQTKKQKTEKEKLKALFRYVEKQYDYRRVMGFQPVKGWEKNYAQEMIAAKKGSCYHYAALYALLAKKATGYPVRIWIGTTNGFNKSVWQPHAWVEVKQKGAWYVCDANLDKYAAGSKGRYFMKKSGKLKGTYKKSKSVTIKG